MKITGALFELKYAETVGLTVFYEGVKQCQSKKLKRKITMNG